MSGLLTVPISHHPSGQNGSVRPFISFSIHISKGSANPMSTRCLATPPLIQSMVSLHHRVALRDRRCMARAPWQQRGTRIDQAAPGPTRLDQYVKRHMYSQRNMYSQSCDPFPTRAAISLPADPHVSDVHSDM